MKKKSNISKKIQSSEPWEKKYNIIDELKDTEEEWENSYDEKRKKKEKEALKKLLKNQNPFTIITNIFSKQMVCQQRRRNYFKPN